MCAGYHSIPNQSYCYLFILISYIHDYTCTCVSPFISPSSYSHWQSPFPQDSATAQRLITPQCCCQKLLLVHFARRILGIFESVKPATTGLLIRDAAISRVEIVPSTSHRATCVIRESFRLSILHGYPIFEPCGCKPVAWHPVAS